MKIEYFQLLTLKIDNLKSKNKAFILSYMNFKSNQIALMDERKFCFVFFYRIIPNKYSIS